MKKVLAPLDDRGPLRVLFLTTSMPVGGAETILVELVRGLDRARFAPELCCLKELGPLGVCLTDEIPVYCDLLGHKYDVGVLGRLIRLLRRRKTDVLVTVGAGDKMFWGRIAARLAGVSVVLSALHSTGWPDRIGRLNRWLTPMTDAFIAVADAHGQYLVEQEGFPVAKVCVIRNGVDTGRFGPGRGGRALRAKLGIPPAAPIAGIVAALRPEKNHELFLAAARQVGDQLPLARFVIVGDGPRRPAIVTAARRFGIADRVHFLGTRRDIPAVLDMLDVFVLSSHQEAFPVSILEAMACRLPVVATRVGSVGESVSDGETGFLVEPGDARGMASGIARLLRDPARARAMGMAGRDAVVRTGSVTSMVRGYEKLMMRLYQAKSALSVLPAGAIRY